MKTQLKVQTEEFKQTELGEFPSNWEIISLEHVIKPDRIKIKVKDFSGKEKIVKKIPFNTGKIVFRNKKGTSTDLYLSDAGHLLTSKINFHQGAVAITDEKMVATTHYEFYKTLDNSDMLYLWYYFRSNHFKEIFAEEIKSRGYKKEANYKFIKDFKIPLPPIQEQKKISYVLLTIQDSILKTKILIDSFKELKKSIMIHLYRFGAVSFDESDTVEIKETEVGKIPKNWDCLKLRNLTIKIKRGASKKTNDKKGYVYLTSDYLTDEGIITFKNIKFLDPSEIKSSKNYLLENFDLIVNCVNSLDKIGKTAVFEGFDKEVVIGFNNYALKLNLDIVNPYFIKYFLLGNGKKQIQKITNPAVKQASFASNHLLNVDVPLPSLPEQQQIVSILSTIDSKIHVEQNKQKALEGLFKSMLNELMTAKIRINNLEVGT